MIKASALILITTLILGCKDKHEEIIPNVTFSGTLNVMQDLTSFTVRVDMLGRPLGYAGVVVYRLSQDTYYVYDQMCPYEKSVRSLVTIPKDGNSIAKCPTCGSEYLLSGGYGDVLKGPTKYPLKAYQNRYEPEYSYLTIWN